MKKFLLLSLFFLFQTLLMQAQQTRVVILHTNDTHSQVEPADNGLGGYARRMGLISKIKAEEKNVLLVDAGDFLQGTPYFNFYGGRIEVDAINRMAYDAITIGNHEFDNGLDSLALILKSSNVPIVSTNYDFSHTPLTETVKPYVVVEKSGLRIGIFGLGINPEGLILQRNYEGLIYRNPFTVADSIARLLKHNFKCDIVLCLSHLGSNPNGSPVNDFVLARNSTAIDVIIGGHTHQLITQTSEPNANGKPVIIAQMGKGGQYLGRIDLTVEKKRIRKSKAVKRT